MSRRPGQGAGGPLMQGVAAQATCPEIAIEITEE